MPRTYEVSSTGTSGRPFSNKSFSTLEGAKAHLEFPGVAFGTIYSNYIGGTVLYNTDPDMEDE